MKQKSYFLILSGFVLLLTAVLYSFRMAAIEVVETVEVAIEFGRGPDCSSRGTCSITGSSGNTREGEQPEGMGKIYFNEDGSMILAIAKSSMDGSLMAEQFTEELFEFDKDLNFPTELLGKLKHPQLRRTHAKIKAGKYEVVEEDDYFRVIIK